MKSNKETLAFFTLGVTLTIFGGWWQWGPGFATFLIGLWSIIIAAILDANQKHIAKLKAMRESSNEIESKLDQLHNSIKSNKQQRNAG